VSPESQQSARTSDPAPKKGKGEEKPSVSGSVDEILANLQGKGPDTSKGLVKKWPAAARAAQQAKVRQVLKKPSASPSAAAGLLRFPGLPKGHVEPFHYKGYTVYTSPKKGHWRALKEGQRVDKAFPYKAGLSQARESWGNLVKWMSAGKRTRS